MNLKNVLGASAAETAVANGLSRAQGYADRERREFMISFYIRTGSDCGAECVARYICAPFQLPKADDHSRPVLPTGREMAWLIK